MYRFVVASSGCTWSKPRKSVEISSTILGRPSFEFTVWFGGRTVWRGLVSSTCACVVVDQGAAMLRRVSMSDIGRYPTTGSRRAVDPPEARWVRDRGCGYLVFFGEVVQSCVGRNPVIALLISEALSGGRIGDEVGEGRAVWGEGAVKEDSVAVGQLNIVRSVLGTEAVNGCG